MGKGRRKSVRGRRKRVKKRGPASLLPWIVISVFIIVIAYVGWSWIAARPATPPTESVHPSATPQPTRPPPPAASVGIVDQFYSQSPGFTDQVVGFLEEHGITYKVHRDADVTIELYRKLPTFGYRLIILRVHAGVSEELEEHPTFLFTAESYTTGEYVVEQLTDQVMSGVMNPDRPENPVFTVGPMFVRMSMEGDFRGATIVLSSCLGLYNHYLAEALIEKGARVFMSWDEKVSLEHTDEGTLTLLEALLIERLTIKEAVEKVMEDVGPDPVYNSKLRYYPPESGKHILPRL